MQKTVLSIAGRPGLYTLVSRGRNMLIVEAIDASKHRFPASQQDRVTSLNDVSIYTTGEDVSLNSVFASVKEHFNGTPIDMEPKKASSADLAKFMEQVLPEYDKDRVYDNDIRKLISWYNILINNGISDFEEAKSTEAAESAEV